MKKLLSPLTSKNCGFPQKSFPSYWTGRRSSKLYIHVYPSIYRMQDIYFQGKLIVIKVHAVKRAREIAFPDQVYDVLRTGKVKTFGKQGIKFIKKGKKGTIICVGEDIGYCIIIKTIERGN
jgi:hypothetical protein